MHFIITQNLFFSSHKTLHGGCTASLVDMITTVAILSHETNKHPGVSVNLNTT
jgi:acyl-coenzyme A thioesterase PaaI-like protein